MDLSLPRKKRRADADADASAGSDHGRLSLASRLYAIAEDITREVASTDAIDSIHRCGRAPLLVLVSRPRAALHLAHTKLHTWPFFQLPQHWRRLYEDASLLLAAELLRRWGNAGAPSPSTSASYYATFEKPCDFHQLGPIVATLDKAIIIAGAPNRKHYIERVLAQLRDAINIPSSHGVANSRFCITKPAMYLSDSAILRAPVVLSFQDFQMHLDGPSSPIIIPSSFEHWPAIQRWHDLSYLMHATLDGQRLVPIEIGDSYNDDTWTQRLVTFSDFVQSYLLPEAPADTGYLAQHDLFEHMPILRADISIPDYCYTTPPPARGAALKTQGLAESAALDEPLLNAWLGPKGTKTPLHTDPYHNILCQVVGYKYVRLFPPEESSKLYARSTNEAGVNMANTTQIDVQYFRPGGLANQAASSCNSEFSKRFPLFAHAKYQEGILAPGESLYIPLGWWHYVESLTTSFSVSFWWN